MAFTRDGYRGFKIQLKIYHTLVIFLIFLIIFTQFSDNDGKECGSKDIRNRPDSLADLEDCTVIKGSLIIVLMTDSNWTAADFDKYSFPKLREITEFMIVYQVYYLKTLRQLFPNLVVIRGEKLFLNYALAIDDVPHLSDIGLISLVSIQRGHIYINRCPILCFVNTIDWFSITTSYGTHVIKQQDNNTCPTRASCRGCKDDRCWSSKDCQKFKDDNLLRMMSTIKCHPLCLGGCRNSSAAGCNVCKGISDLGVCVEKCPSNKVLIPEYFRCYSREDCRRFGRIIYQNECLLSCPAGFSTTDFSTGEISQTECFPCRDQQCPKICEPNAVQHLSDAERLKGCTIINGTLQIHITNRISEKELQQHLSSIEEIYGLLKIYRTPLITSLSFLRGLKKIHGQELEYNKFSLVIYYNQNLVDLWPRSKGSYLTLVNGGMFIHSNYKLCFLKIREFQNETLHNRTLDYLPKTDEEPACNPIKLETSFKVLGIDSVTIRWKELDNTLVNGTEYILFYTDVPLSNKSQTKNEDVCYEDVWKTQLILQKDLQRSGEHFIYNLTNLKQYTQYAFYVKTYRIKEKDDNFTSSESDIQYFTTEAPVPSEQNITTSGKTADSLTLTWLPRLDKHERIDYYIIDLFYEPDKKEILDLRDYCVDQFEHDQAEANASCGCLNDESSHQDDFNFQTKLGESFHCFDIEDEDCKHSRYSNRYKHETGSGEHSGNYEDLESWPAPNSETFVKSMLFKSEQKTYTITGLEPFRLYIIHFYACNNITRCGPYTLHSDRTQSDPERDRVFMKIDVSSETHQPQLEFDEPKQPNGLTVAYNINLKDPTCDKESCVDFICITRLEHESAHFRYVLNLDRGVYEVRVRSVSLAGPGPYSDWVELSLAKQQTEFKTISWVWYLVVIIGAIVSLYLFVRWRKRAERIPASALIRYRNTDRDELLVDFE
ncbi:insulin-like receptor isoform X2 [Hermetia illucens]|uniref:insulin-like receptor isoform X2 n=1 Tax=Hermetia illucens TaxID=343691 RepID=UPI0018CC3DC5|nr:insulin-like receptor isoform X2 [Hermetia illucens]